MDETKYFTKCIQKVIFELKQWFLNLLRTDKAWKSKILIIDAHQKPEILHWSRVQSTLNINSIHGGEA